MNAQIWGKAGVGMAVAMMVMLGFNDEVLAQSSENYHELPAVSNAPNARTAAKHIDGELSKNIGNRFAVGAPRTADLVVGQSATGQGLSAGNGTSPLSAWVDGTYSHLDIDHPVHGQNGNVWTGIGGMDYMVNDTVVVGLAVGYQHTSMGLSLAPGGVMTQKEKFATPYAAWRPLTNTVIDGFIGLGDGYSITHSNTAGAGEMRYDHVKKMAGLNATQTYTMGNVELMARLNNFYTYDHAQQTDDILGRAPGLDILKTRIGQSRLGGQAGYTFGWATPYMGASYAYDWTISEATALNTRADHDPHEVELTGGVDFLFLERFQAGVAGAYTFLRDDTDETSVMVNGRMNF